MGPDFLLKIWAAICAAAKRSWQMALSLCVIVEKNIRRLMSSKISASLIIFGPLVMIVLTGLAFQSMSVFGIKVGVYSDTYTDLSERVITTMKDSSFTVEKTISEEDCIQRVKDAKTHLCIILPADYETGRMDFYVDYSRMSLVYLIINRISEQIKQLSSQMSVDFTQRLVDGVKSAGLELAQSKEVIVQMRADASALEAKLTTIKTNVAQVDIGDISTLDSINDPHSTLNQNLESSKKDLSKLKQSAAQAKANIRPAQEKLAVMRVNLDKAFVTMNCSSAGNLTDLTDSLASDDFASDLEKTPHATCSLIYTFRRNVETQQKQLDSSVDDLSDLERKTTSLQSQILIVEAQVKADGARAQRNIEDFNLRKQNLTRELDAMSLQSISARDRIGAAGDQLGRIVDGFSTIAQVDPHSIVNPIKTEIKSLTGKKQSNLDRLFPSLVMLVVMFVSLLIGNMLVMKERTSKANFRNNILPVHEALFIAGTHVTTMIIALIQVAIVTGIGAFFFGVALTWNAMLVPLVLVAILIFGSVGMIIAYTTASEETSALLSIIVCMILLLFSNILSPIESMAPNIAAIARFSPFSMAETLLRRFLIYGAEAAIPSILVVAFIVEFVVAIVVVSFCHHVFSKRRA